MEMDSSVEQPAEAEACTTSRERESRLLGDDHETAAEVRQLLKLLPGTFSSAAPGEELENLTRHIRAIVGDSFAELVSANSSRVLEPGDAKEAPERAAHQPTAELPFTYWMIALNSYMTSLASRRLGDGVSRRQVQRAGQESNQRLSARECAVLALIARGQSNKRVAQTLRIGPETVKSYVKRVFLKLGSKTRAEAVSRATELGLLSNATEPPTSSDKSTSSMFLPHSPPSTHPARRGGSAARVRSEPSVVGAV
jgi:ATP/maltotriose-dependent transcriptional regulator MalT